MIKIRYIGAIKAAKDDNTNVIVHEGEPKVMVNIGDTVEVSEKCYNKYYKSSNYFQLADEEIPENRVQPETTAKESDTGNGEPQVNERDYTREELEKMYEKEFGKKPRWNVKDSTLKSKLGL